MGFKRNSKITKALALSLSLSMAMPFVGSNVNVYANSPDPIAAAYADEGYSLVFDDEFDGEQLNLDKWNVESHEPGWVNEELQRYVTKEDMSENIMIEKDGDDSVLRIKPTAEKKGTPSPKPQNVEILKSNDFSTDDWTLGINGGNGSVEFTDGKAIVTVTNPGTDNSGVQLQTTKLSIIKGHTYEFKVKASSTVARKTEITFIQPGVWKWFGGSVEAIGTTEGEITCKFTPEVDCDDVNLQLNFGLINNSEADSSAATITLSDVSVIDLTAAEAASSELAPGEILSSNAFSADAWALGTNGGNGEVSFENGKAIVTVTNPGNDNSGVQLQTTKLSIIKGHTYQFKVKASSTVARKTEITFIQPGVWKWFGGSVEAIGTTEGEITCKFTPEVDCDDVNLQLNFGLINNSEADSSAATITLSDISVIDLTVAEASGEGEETEKPFDYNDYNIASGRINTQNKFDFTYGRFECRAKVPSGMGYLPAFWLMATDETNYGQWPQCGEMDIMEVMGQNTKKSYHTIHYGYDPKQGHRENQGTKVLEDDDYSENYHIFTLDWEPGKLTWYVDGEEVYTTNDWYTGKDEDSNLTYPAPFDQNFYVILNLAVGGEWVQYPTEDVINNIMAGNPNQSYYVDYVRVYQKDKSVYDKMETEVVAPKHETTYREPDTNGNYVVNGDFSQDLKPMNSTGDNFELHLETDADKSTYSIKNNEIKIVPSAVGANEYSVQLKQTGVPMYQGWDYELSFDAYADEERSIIVDIEGHKKGYTRYFGDKTETITKNKKSYSYEFTMEHKTDADAALEFCLGKQGSTAAVYLSNIKLVCKSKENAVEEGQKTVRTDGNYIYNGSFDQGKDRLGYWEMSEEDAERVSVTNKLEEGNKNKVRELRAVIEAPQGTSEVNPIVLSQDELAPLLRGSYDLSFDAYMEDGGQSDAITVTVAGVDFTPQITTTRQNYLKTLKFRNDVTRNENNVQISITKPGTYYIDNVFLTESLLIKNGMFDAGMAGFETFAGAGGEATSVIDNMSEGSDNTFVMSISNVGNEDYSIQLIQKDVTLKNGEEYELSFDAKSDVTRQILYDISCNGNLEKDTLPNEAWENYTGTSTPVEINNTWKTIHTRFTMNFNTDTRSIFKISMGKIGEVPEGKHDVYIDNIILKPADVELTPDQQQQKEEEDAQIAAPVSALLNTIDVDKIELNDESAAIIHNAVQAYYDLTVDQQDTISDEVYAKLYNAQQKYNALAKADALKTLINDIGELDLSDECEAKVAAAEKAYKKMSEYQKDFVDGDDLQVLTDARKTLTAVNNVVDKIAKIPAEIDASDYSKEAIEAAEKAYNELTDAQKAVLGDENVAKITAARAAYEAEVAKANPAPADPTPAPVNPTVAPAAPTPAAATPTPTPTATPAVEEKLDNGDGKVQKGEKAETEIGTFTAISAKAASFKPNENGLSKSTITIPATVKIDGQTVKVTTIVKNSFKGDKKLKKVTLGANVTTIQAGSFQDCTNLKTVVTKGKSIKKAGSKAFSNTNKNLTFKLGKNYKKCAKKYKKLFKKAGAPKKFKVKK